MPRKNITTRKETYRLWWEYLRRSEKYRRLCELNRTGKNRKEARKLEEDFPEDVLFFFGDIHSGSFDDWWSETEKVIEKNSVEDYLPIFAEDVAAFVEEWDKLVKPGKPRSLEKEIKYFFEHKWLSRKFLFLMITLGDPANIDDLLAQIKDILEKQRKELMKSDEFGEFFPPRLYPTQPIRIDELKRYLEVYDLRKDKKKWTEVAKIVYPKRDWNGSLERSLLMDLVKAKRVISNVEEGEFPGKY